MECNYRRSSPKGGGSSMAITVQGYQVALRFADEPNTQVASQVKQALLGMYLAAGK